MRELRQQSNRLQRHRDTSIKFEYDKIALIAGRQFTFVLLAVLFSTGI